MAIQGKLLTDLIERELELMLAEGFEKSPITAKNLHTRLKSKGHIKGGLSTLSTEIRKSIISEYKQKQMRKAGLSDKSKRAFDKGRNNEYFKNRYHEKCQEVTEMKQQLDKNTSFLVDLIVELEATCPTPLEKLLTPHLVTAKNMDKDKNS